MTQSTLELLSSHGDQGLARLRFVLHGSADAAETASIQGDGLRFAEGQSVVSTSLANAYGWTGAGQLGRVMIFAIPPDLRVGTGVFTTAFIDRKLKQVTGAPLRYAAARHQLALYSSGSADKDTVRQQVESEVESGRGMELQKQLTLLPQYLVGSFEPSEAIPKFLYQLDRLLATFQPFDYQGLVAMLEETFRVSQPAQAVQAKVALQEIIIGTAESKVMSRLRTMRWEGLAMLGYQFFEGRDAAEIGPAAKDVAEQYQRLEMVRNQLDGSSLFSGELSWLKVYAMNELAMMKLELDGDSVEAPAS